MKTIAVYFTDPHFNGYPFNKEEYRSAYHDLAAMIAEKGGRFVIVRGLDTYREGMTFSRYWAFENDDFRLHDEPISVDMMYDKGEDFVGDANTRFANDPAFDAVCSDKELTAEMFPDLVPVTFVAHAASELDGVLQKIPTDTVVAKPIDGAEGRGIFIESKKDIAKHVTDFPYLIQEFVDTSDGIPGLVDGMHDFRMVCINGEVVVSYIRTPAEGLRISNVSLGGKETEVLIGDIPDEALNMMKIVDAKLSRYPRRIYSADFARGKGGNWRLIELNAKVGLSPLSMGKNYRHFYEKLTDLLLGEAYGPA
ncbi:hypothetical protein K8942_02950 [Candidatus Peribacteria bacterium]|nr:MAG: hypothetical protein K8942_02950 [Candidatus Peribacteria bacterium]